MTQLRRRSFSVHLCRNLSPSSKHARICVRHSSNPDPSAPQRSRCSTALFLPGRSDLLNPFARLGPTTKQDAKSFGQRFDYNILPIGEAPAELCPKLSFTITVMIRDYQDNLLGQQGRPTLTADTATHRRLRMIWSLSLSFIVPNFRGGRI